MAGVAIYHDRLVRWQLVQVVGQAAEADVNCAGYMPCGIIICAAHADNKRGFISSDQVVEVTGFNVPGPVSQICRDSIFNHSNSDTAVVGAAVAVGSAVAVGVGSDSSSPAQAPSSGMVISSSIMPITIASFPHDFFSVLSPF